MIQKVSLYFILPMCILAFFLALVGVERIQFGDDYYLFLKNVSASFENWRLEIPDIPKVPLIQKQDYSSSGKILQVLISIGNFFANFLNVLIGIINIITNILNIVIQLIQFIMTCIYQCKDFINRVGSVRIAWL